ncbi:uncharacterized protein LOC113279079 [Papaver somniferum]|uniref:uncharacterized protein LOC113279079 n=1 Tax=Papaver somniferum TaxID=3469 RepID=UPI000E6FB87C|nr:uncharacterized protein LOC113279079 [Papaver somniferum]
MAIKDLQKQMGQLTTDMNQLKAQTSTKLSSQTFVNLIENVNAMLLRSGKQTEEPKKQEKVSHDLEKDVEVETVPKENPTSTGQPKDTIPNFTTPPFPSRFVKSKKQVQDEEILDILRKLQINIPFIEAIRLVPRYAKVLRDLCTKNERLIPNEITQVGESASAMLLKKMPAKCKDLGGFTVPITIGTKRFERALLDLGASVSVMSIDVYDSLNLGPLKETGIVIQLDNKSNIYPKGLMENVLVQVNELIFLVDFFVVDMHNGDNCSSTSLLLGRPFMKTGKTKIDVDSGTLTMEFDKEIIHFNIFEAMQYPSDVHSVFSIDVVDSLDHKVFDDRGSKLDSHNLPLLDMDLDAEFLENCGAFAPQQKFQFDTSTCMPLPIIDEIVLYFVVQALKLEPKPPYHFTYPYLGDGEKHKELWEVQSDKVNVDSLEFHDLLPLEE